MPPEPQELPQGVLAAPQGAGLFQARPPAPTTPAPAPGSQPPVTLPPLRKRDDLLEPALAGPYETWKATPTPQTAGALLDSLKPVLESGLRSYGDPDSPLQRGSAKRLVLESLGRYDPKRAALKTFLLGQLQGLRRLKARQENVIALPEQVLLDQHHVYEETERLRDQLGRDPDLVELADRTGLSRKRLALLRQAGTGVPQGQMVTQGEDGPEPFSPAGRLPGAQDDEEAWVSLVHQGLEPTDRLILEHTLGMEGKEKLSGQALARKLHISSAAVSQRKARLQGLLNRRDELKPF